jgi:hypothetical protein
MQKFCCQKNDELREQEREREINNNRKTELATVSVG